MVLATQHGTYLTPEFWFSHLRTEGRARKSLLAVDGALAQGITQGISQQSP